MATLLTHQTTWRCQDLSLQFGLQQHNEKYGASLFGGYEEWENNTSAQRSVLYTLGTRLSSETTRSVGISVRTGELEWIPAAAWRLFQDNPRSNTRLTSIEGAFEGRLVRVARLRGGYFEFFPLLSLRELSLAFEAEEPAPEPNLAPAKTVVVNKELPRGADSDDQASVKIRDESEQAPGEEALAINPHQRSRKKPSGHDYRESDRPLVIEMNRLIETKKANNATDAARMLAKQAVGTGTENSKVTRLISRYSGVFRAN